ncbi:hypothetical protein C8R43DRAFT_1139636 [Mycena crocata]|nr:hypothetical protein C8R43DRAFT_1139636 [Mycena crocata]
MSEHTSSQEAADTPILPLDNLVLSENECIATMQGSTYTLGGLRYPADFLATRDRSYGKRSLFSFKVNDSRRFHHLSGEWFPGWRPDCWDRGRAAPYIVTVLGEVVFRQVDETYPIGPKAGRRERLRLRCPVDCTAAVAAFFNTQVSTLRNIVQTDATARPGVVIQDWVGEDYIDVWITACTMGNPSLSAGAQVYCEVFPIRTHQLTAGVLLKEYLLSLDYVDELRPDPSFVCFVLFFVYMSTPVDVPLAADPVEVLRQARFIAKMQMARNIAADVPGVDYRATRDQTVIVPPGVKAHRFSYKDGYRRERLWDMQSLTPKIISAGYRTWVLGRVLGVTREIYDCPTRKRGLRPCVVLRLGCIDDDDTVISRVYAEQCDGFRRVVALEAEHSSSDIQVVSWLGGSAETPHLKIVSDALALEERYPVGTILVVFVLMTRDQREESGRPVEKIYTLWSDAVCNIAALPPSNDLALLYPGVPE